MSRFDLGILCVLCLGALFGACAEAQQVNIYLSDSWDQGTGDYYAYSEATADYSTGYYYSLCTQVYLWQTPGSLTYSNESCSNTDAVVNWYTTVSTSQVTIDLQSENLIEMDYYASQFDSGCGDECNWYWDAYQAYLINGGSYENSGYWNLAGPPGLPQESDFWVYANAPEASTCDFTISPTSAHTNYCNTHSETSQLFGANVTPSLSQCLPVSGSCSASYGSGDLTMDATTPFTCNIQSYTISGHANFFGPGSASSNNYVNVGFSLNLSGRAVSHNQSIQIICP